MLQYQPSPALDQLVRTLHQAVAIDKIYLLGVATDNLPVNSIFRPFFHGEEPAAGYFLLLLTRPGEKKSDDVIQDMLEQRNRLRMPVNLIVHPVKVFYQWLKAGQAFAIQVVNKAPLLYNAGITNLPAPGYDNLKEHLVNQETQAQKGYDRSVAFLSGARQFIERQQFNLAAFLLHQASEHACMSFVLQSTGLRTGTHNIDKLLRYSTMMGNALNSIFPRTTAEDIELFRLLQKAYIHGRYKEDYMISEEQILILAARVEKLVRRFCPDADLSQRMVEEAAVPWPSRSGKLKKAGRGGRSKLPAGKAAVNILQDQYQKKYDHQYCTYGKIDATSAEYLSFLIEGS
jgi:HEPN domain-containing protein